MPACHIMSHTIYFMVCFALSLGQQISAFQRYLRVTVQTQVNSNLNKTASWKKLYSISLVYTIVLDSLRAPTLGQHQSLALAQEYYKCTVEHVCTSI